MFHCKELMLYSTWCLWWEYNVLLRLNAPGQDLIFSNVWAEWVWGPELHQGSELRASTWSLDFFFKHQQPSMARQWEALGSVMECRWDGFHSNLVWERWLDPAECSGGPTMHQISYQCGSSQQGKQKFVVIHRHKNWQKWSLIERQSCLDLADIR